MLQQHVESLIFVAEDAISIREIKNSLQSSLSIEIKNKELTDVIEALKAKYQDPSFSIEIIEINNGFQFMTKAAFHNSVGSYLRLINKKKLTKAALETLSIIAYKQPVTRTELESIRGVNSDYTIQKLLEKELVVIDGRAEGPGRPLIYSTSRKFMDYFGLKSLEDLPKPKDFQLPDNAIGEPAPVEEEVVGSNLLKENEEE